VFDLVLLDVMMPEVDGFAVCRRIKEDPRLKDIPVIFLTAKGGGDALAEGFESGAVMYINKPFTANKLLTIVNTMLESAATSLSRGRSIRNGPPPSRGAFQRESMDPILDKARAAQNALERLMNSVPGFKGYRERDLRRDADRLQREHISARLEDGKKALNQVAAALTRGGDLDVINDVETARKRIDKVANRIRYAERGLQRLLRRGQGRRDDPGQGVCVRHGPRRGRRRRARGRLRRHGGERPAGALQDLIGRIDALDARLSERENVLRGVK
jgi:response regulator RpfG family c-di-GMP phosphodiesterase